jgi:hypothetical protein
MLRRRFYELNLHELSSQVLLKSEYIYLNKLFYTKALNTTFARYELGMGKKFVTANICG